MIEIKDLCFSYNNLTPYILDNINLNIKKGEYISILGDNGSGKSTLLKLILGFLTPLKGSLKINSNKLGYVPQVFENFNSDFPITVYEMLNCHRKALKIKNKDIVDNSLSLVKMDCFKNDLIGNLSGGQRQKIFITRSLMGNPDILILDEPSTGIDIKSQKEIYTLIKELNIKKNITVISVEHNLKAALDNSSRIFLLNSGKGQCYSKEDFYKIKEAFI